MRKLVKLALLVGMVVGLTPVLPVSAATKLPLAATIRTDEPVMNTYFYEITPEATNPTGAVGEPRTATVVFNREEPVAGMATAVTEIDFGATQYAHTGVYRYIVEEVGSSDPAAMPPVETKFEIYVLVVERNGALVPEVQNQAKNLDTGEKEDLVFPHQIYTYLYVENYTEGVLSNTSEYFRYKLEVKGPVGTKYTVAGQDELITYEGRSFMATTEYEVKAGTDNYIYVYLKDNQSLTVGLAGNGRHQISVGTQYRIMKDRVNKWHTTINGQDFANEWEMMEYLVAGRDPMANKIVIINEREFDVPTTGVFLSLWPFALLIGLGAAGIVLLKKGKRDEERIRARRKRQTAGRKTAKKAGKKAVVKPRSRSNNRKR